MNDYISRAEVLDKWVWGSSDKAKGKVVHVEDIESIPTADVKPTDDDIYNYLMSRNQVILTQELLTELCRKPVVRGEWIPKEEKHLWKCSVCGNIIFSEDAVDKKVYHAFCGKCGSDMRGDSNESI